MSKSLFYLKCDDSFELLQRKALYSSFLLVVQNCVQNSFIIFKLHICIETTLKDTDSFPLHTECIKNIYNKLF